VYKIRFGRIEELRNFCKEVNKSNLVKNKNENDVGQESPEANEKVERITPMAES
jgi:hypothetical protein